MALTDNLISYWRLEEASGTGDAVDATATGNNLTASASMNSVTGMLGNTRDFTAGIFSHTTNASLETDNNTSYTFTLWGRVPDRTNYHPYIAKWADEYQLYYDQAQDRIAMYVFGSGAGQVVFANTYGQPPLGQFLFIVGGYNATTDEVFVSVNNQGATSGLDVASFSNAGYVASSNTFYLGHNGSHYLVDLMDEVGFWKRALTADEITYLYNGGSGRSYAEITGGGGTPFIMQLGAQRMG